MMKPIFAFFFIIAAACTSDAETQEALENSKQIKRLNDSLGERIRRAHEVIERNQGSSEKFDGFQKIEPLNDFKDSVGNIVVKKYSDTL